MSDEGDWISLSGRRWGREFLDGGGGGIKSELTQYCSWVSGVPTNLQQTNTIC